MKDDSKKPRLLDNVHLLGTNMESEYSGLILLRGIDTIMFLA